MNTSQHNPLLEAALSYAARGWHVFPCKPKDKAPATPNGVKDATTDKQRIKTWWAKMPDANIGMACGDKSGVYVVDVDLSTTVDGFEALKEFPELPMTVLQRSPRGGCHYLYKCDGEPPLNKNGFRPGIDIRATGFYLLLSPSIHPNGNEYVWAPDQGPGEIELAEFPDFMKPPKRKRLAPWERAELLSAAPVAKDVNISDLERRASAYLATLPPAIEGMAGHSALLTACRALVWGFDLPIPTASRLIWSEYNPRCNPPWDSTNAKEVERKLEEADKLPFEKPRGYLRDAETDFAQVSSSPIPDSIIESRDALIDAHSKASVLKAKAEEFPEWPDYLFKPCGMVGELFDWINETAGCYQPKLALGAALVACGAIMGRKVRDINDGRTNLYMMGVAHSSAGKDHPGACIQKLFTAAGLSQYLGGSRVTSDSAIEVALQTHPVQFFVWDEIGHMFAAIKQAGVGSGNGAHLRTIVPALMTLYSSADKEYIGKQFAEGEVRRILQPHCCVWGITSPDKLMESISRAELRDGWLGRVMTIISHERPKYVIKESIPPTRTLIEKFQKWATISFDHDEGTGDILAATTPALLTVPMDKEAKRLLEEFIDFAHQKMLDCEKANDDTGFLWGKAGQNARRIALILAGGDRLENPEITAYHMRYSIDITRCMLEDFRAAIEYNVAEGQYEAEKQRVLKLIASRGTKGMTRTELTRRTQNIRDRKLRDEYLLDLIEAGLIQSEIKGKKQTFTKI